MITINLPRFFIISSKVQLKIYGTFNGTDKDLQIKVKIAKNTTFCNVTSEAQNKYSFNTKILLKQRFSLLKIKVSYPNSKSFCLRRIFVIYTGKINLHATLQHINCKKNILVVCHEISLTGAPILGKKLACELNKNYNVFLWVGKIVNRNLLSQFKQHCCQIIEGFTNTSIKKLPKLDFAIFNSIVTTAAISQIAKSTKTILLIHEFSYTCSPKMITDAQKYSNAIVFPNTIVRNSYDNLEHNNIFIHPQGFIGYEKAHNLSNTHIDFLKQQNKKIVLSCGTICSRKGYDLFLQTAQKYRREYPHEKVLFVWIGKPSRHNPEYDLWQKIYNKLVGVDNVYIIPPQKKLEDFFCKANIFYMCSRLDPCPNVVIDAMYYKKPIILFDKGCGCTEFFKVDSPGAKIIPYLDVAIAAKEIHLLLQNTSLCKEMGDKNNEYVRKNLNFSNYIENIKTIASN